jgi:hypothetical protein
VLQCLHALTLSVYVIDAVVITAHTAPVNWLTPGMRHLVFVYDGGTTQTFIYVDTVQTASYACGQGVYIPQTVGAMGSSARVA